MKQFSPVLLGLLLAFFSSGSALAAKKPSAAKSVSEVKTALERFSLGFWGRVSGPGLSDPISDKQPDASGNPDATDPLEWYQSVQLSYDTGVYGISPFLVLRGALHAFDAGDGVFEAKNPRIGATAGGYGLFNTGIGKLEISYLRLDMEIPATQSSRDSGLVLAPGTEIGLALPIKGSQFTVGGNWAYRYNILSGQAPSIPQSQVGSSPQDSEVWTKAFVKYTASDKIWLALSYESDLFHLRGDATEIYISDGSVLRTQVGISVHPKVSVRPFLVWNPRHNLSATSIGFDLSGRFF